MSSVRSLKIIAIIFLLIFTTSYSERKSEQSNNNICKESRCGKNGPAIRFPFRLRNDRKKPENDTCGGYPGFDLICIGDATAIHLPSRPSPPNKNLFVSEIDYRTQRISIFNPAECSVDRKSHTTPGFFETLKISPFEFDYEFGYTLFECPSSHVFQGIGQICELGTNETSRYVAMMPSTMDFVQSLPDLVSCSMMYEVPLNTNGALDLRVEATGYPLIKWSEPDCRHCEAKGERCRLSGSGTECFDISGKRKGRSNKYSFMIAGISIGVTFFIAAILYFYTADNNEKENRKRIEKFLEDYKACNPSRYTYADIKRITSKFNEKLGQGAYGTVFKGKLSNEVCVAVKILNGTFKGNGDEFINEVSTMGHIHHVNVVRLVGFCADGFNRALVYEFLPNDSLEKYISSEAKGENRSLSWEKLQDIALGIATGIEYLHQGCDQRILHFDIKPHNVLLDQNFNPKIADFGMAKLCSKDQSFVSMSAARGTLGYIAPEVFSRNFGNVSYKSDVYSFGMLLLEMVGGRKNTNNSAEGGDNSKQIYYPEWIYNLLEEGEDFRIHIEDECDATIAKKLAIVGLWCIQWHPVSRPAMKVAVQMLEGKEELTMPPNPFASASPSESNFKIPAKPLALELETIVE